MLFLHLCSAGFLQSHNWSPFCQIRYIFSFTTFLGTHRLNEHYKKTSVLNISQDLAVTQGSIHASIHPTWDHPTQMHCPTKCPLPLFCFRSFPVLSLTALRSPSLPLLAPFSPLSLCILVAHSKRVRGVRFEAADREGEGGVPHCHILDLDVRLWGEEATKWDEDNQRHLFAWNGF